VYQIESGSISAPAPLLSYHITSRDTTRCDRIAQLPSHYNPHSAVERSSCHGVEARRAFARRTAAMPTCVLRVPSVNFLHEELCAESRFVYIHVCNVFSSRSENI